MSYNTCAHILSFNQNKYKDKYKDNNNDNNKNPIQFFLLK